MNAVTTGADLERALQYVRNSPQRHRPPASSMEENWGKYKTSKICILLIVILKSGAHETPNLRASPLAAVVTHKERIIYDLSFEEQSREKNGGSNRQ